MTMTFLHNAWGDVGRALYDVPDTELPELEDRLRSLAHTEPGRTAQVFAAFAGVVHQERTMRYRESVAHSRSHGKPAS